MHTSTVRQLLQTLARARYLLVPAALCFAPAPAGAQAGFGGDTVCARGSRIESDAPCPVANAGDEVVIEHELELTTRIEAITLSTRMCEAEASISYSQRITLARVEGTIENFTCGASSGSLVLFVRTENESGEQSSQEFTQDWQRADDQPVNFTADYPIGENVDLVSVRAVRLRCTCTE